MGQNIRDQDMLDLLYWPTPNGKSDHSARRCGLDYNIIECNIGKGDQFTDEFLAINPNNRMPTLVDLPDDGGGPLSVFESGAIMLYIAEDWPVHARRCARQVRGGAMGHMADG